jgi:hypothetical protein
MDQADSLLDALLLQLRTSFSMVAAPRPEGRTGNVFIDLGDGSRKWTLCVTERFLVDSTLEESAERVKNRDVISAIKTAAPGSTIKLTEDGLK